MKKEKKSQLWVEPDEEMYTVSWLLSLKVKQDDKYVVIKSSNSDKEYKMISFSSNNNLSENQRMSLSVTVNKFYSKIWLMKKECLSEL